MKINKLSYIKLALSTSLLLGVSACSNLETDLQVNPSQLTQSQVNAPYLLNQAQISTGQFLNEINNRVGRVMRHRNMFSFYSSDFNSTQPEGWDDTWEYGYRHILKNVNTLEKTSDAVNGNIPYYVGEAQVLKAFTLINLVDLFGDIPYSEATNDAILNPKVDSGKDVYKAAWDILQQAESNFNKTQNTVSFPFTNKEDMFYSGDVAKWKKLINSLRLKILVQTKDVWSDLGWNGATIFTNIVASPSNYISSNADDFDFKYSTTSSPTDSRHPLYRANYVNAPGQFESNYLIYSMITDKGLIDPRTRYYFYRQTSAAPSGTELPCDGNALYTPTWRCYVGSSYRGRAHGDDAGVPNDATKRTVPGLYPAGGAYDANTYKSTSLNPGAGGLGIIPIIDANFVNFIIAELYLKMGNSTQALTALDNAVNLSITKVMNFNSSFATGTTIPTSTAITAYKTKVTSLYNAATSDAGRLKVIIKEYFIASYGNGIEAYNAYRRTGYPNDMEAPLKTDTFPRTMLYPSNFVNSNSNAPSKPVTTQVFWDKNPAGFIK